MRARLAIVLWCVCAQDAAGQATTQSAPANANPAEAEAATPSELEQLDESVARVAEAARRSAEASLAAKDYPAALKALQQAHELDPKHAGAAARLAELY